MPETGLKGFDRTVQETNAWLHEISMAMNHPSKQLAYHALRGVLFALRDRLPVDEAFDFAAQLPMLMRGFFFEGYQAADKPEKYHHDEFLQRVRYEVQLAGGINPERATRAVLQVLSHHMDLGEVNHIRQALPADLRKLWPELTELEI